MEVHVLASGSSGNATYLQLGQARILVDAGISTRRIQQSLIKLGTSIAELDGILITHEHRDHIYGLETLMKKFHVPVYATAKTWDAMYLKARLPDNYCVELKPSFTVQDVCIEPFRISHDAADPVGYSIYGENMKCSMATDLGFVTEGVKQALALSDVLVLESNHDVKMLENGSYPWYLKKRILSNRGHLSNLDAGWLLTRLERKNHTHVFLAHMSKENNTPEVAKSTVCEVLQSQKLTDEFSIHLTYPDCISSLSAG
ncbi:phosphoribosyl 1 [Sporomusaceae bacterium BoRhaA]|uniref:MBL fold metallo-hydrolase n=1 Tax=Pelorhabdus rhamnosifermentans TaxID=2772457 RepID=UPI001C060793|nr:MBL fold metallo-hydrolase [Pelorhabdus rhamnosifermentans]MBU2702538.1 phosphoribosyl 1 [Pelorhabdus rhamnosifermentans]